MQGGYRIPRWKTQKHILRIQGQERSCERRNKTPPAVVRLPVSADSSVMGCLHRASHRAEPTPTAQHVALSLLALTMQPADFKSNRSLSVMGMVLPQMRLLCTNTYEYFVPFHSCLDRVHHSPVHLVMDIISTAPFPFLFYLDLF